MDSVYVEMVSWQKSQPLKILIPNLTEYKIYSRKLGYHAIKMNATQYPNTYKAILNNNEVINDNNLLKHFSARYMICQLLKKWI